jgi:hypothetical protein
LSVHALLAGIAKTPELALDPGEGKLLAQGMIDVAKFYPVVVDPKTLAWINLSMIAGTVYGTRIFAIAAKQSAKKNEGLPPDNVRNFTGKPN